MPGRLRSFGLQRPLWRIALALVATSSLTAVGAFVDPHVVCAADGIADALRSPSRAATLSERLLSDARDGRLDDFSFLSAALIASGVQTADELRHWGAMYVGVRDTIAQKLPAGTTTDRMRAIHALAHRFILTGAYQESCSDLRLTFANGEFNCLTSLAVCLDLCSRSGLEVQAVLVRGHVALAYPKNNNQLYVVEPGASDWQTRPLSEPAGSRTLTAVELISKFYYNRGIEQLRKTSYEQGIALLRVSLAMDAADDDARRNLAAGLNNWAVEHCRFGRYEQAAALVEQGRALDPSFEPLVANEQMVRAKLGK